jgi:hypothetical protein
MFTAGLKTIENQWRTAQLGNDSGYSASMAKEYLIFGILSLQRVPRSEDSAGIAEMHR